MKVLYDEEHKACAVRFDKDDTLFIYQTDDGVEFHSCKGGKPEMINEQLAHEFGDEDLEGEE